MVVLSLMPYCAECAMAAAGLMLGGWPRKGCFIFRTLQQTGGRLAVARRKGAIKMLEVHKVLHRKEGGGVACLAGGCDET